MEDYSLDSGVMAAKLILNFVVYADGNAEVLHDPILNATTSGQGPLESISAGRKAMLKHKQDLLKLAKEIFSDAGDAHPAATMTDRLRQVAGTDSTMQAELRGFKKPEWRHGNEAEFIPADEREYMRRFVADQEIWVTELAKNQVKGGQQ